MADKSSLEGGLQYVPAIVLAQIIYLDFDGELTRYEGEILTLDNVEVQDALLTAERINNIVSQLNERYASKGIQFVTQRPVGQEYSTIFVGKTDAFDQYGTFKGLAETIDEGNANKTDKAFVNLDTTATDTEIISTIAHETDHLLGTLNHGGDGLQAYADYNRYDVSSGITSSGVILGSGESMYVSSCGTATSATVNYGGTLVLLNGGVVVDTIVNSGGILSISAGASATGIVADSTARLNINLSSETLVEGTIGGNAFMCSDGYVSGFTVANSSSYFSLSSGVVGSALTVVSTGILFATEGSFIDQLTVSRRGSAYIWGSANNATIYSSGSMTVYSGAYVNGVSVQEYGSLIINSGGAATVTGIVGHKDSVIFADITSQTRLIQGTHGDNAFTISNGSMGNGVVTFVPLVSEGGVLNSVTIIENCYIGSGGSAGAITVSSEGRLTLSAGGSVSDLTLKKGARLGGFAFAEDIYVDSAVNRIEISAGVTVGGSSLSVASGYTVEKISAFGDTARMYVDSGGVAENTVMSGGWMYASGVIRDTVVESGAFIYVYQDAVVSNLTVSAGGIVGGMVFAETRSWNYASGTLEAAENVSIAGAQMTVSSGGRAENIVASYGKLYVSSGGQIVSGGAKAAGEIFISSGGTAVDTFMSSGGHIYILSGGTLTGSLYVHSRGYVSVSSGGKVDFDISDRNSVQGYLFNNLSEVGGTPTYTITVSADQESGTYKLAQGAGDFTGTLSVGDGTVNYGSVTVNGEVFKYNGTEYTLTQTNGDLLLNIAATEPSVFIYSSGTLTSSGSVISGAALVSGGNNSMSVSSGGTATSATVSSGGSMSVSSGGMAEGVLVYEGGKVNNGITARSGFTGYIGEITKNSTGDEIGGVNSNLAFSMFCNVKAGATLENSIVYQGGGLMLNSGAAATGITLENGKLSVKTGATLSNVVINNSSSGMLDLYSFSNGSISDITLENGYIWGLRNAEISARPEAGADGYIANGYIENLVVSNGDFTWDGLAKNILLSGSGSSENFVTISGGASLYNAEIAMWMKISSGAKVIDSLQTSGNVLIYSGAYVSNYTVAGGWADVMNGSAYDLKLTNGGYFKVYENGYVSDVFIEDKSHLDVYSGVAEKVIVSSGGSQLVEKNGTVRHTAVEEGGYLSIGSGGSASDTIISGGIAVVSGGSLNNTVIQNSALSDLYSTGILSAADNAVLTDTIVNYGGYLGLYGSNVTADGITVNEGGYMNLQNGSLKGVTIDSGGKANICGGSSEDGIVVSSGGNILFLNHYAGDITLKQGGILLGFAFDSDRTWNCTNESNFSFGEYTSLSYSSSSNSDILTSIFVRSGGSMDGISIVNSGNTLMVAGGKVSNVTVNSGGRQTVRQGGEAVNVVLNSGFMYVGPSGTAYKTVVNGGNLIISSGGAGNETTVNSGFLRVSSGGLANDIVANSGGRTVVVGTVNNISVASGGFLSVSAAGKIGGTMQFNSGAVVSAFDGGIIDFTLSGRTAADDYLVNDLSLITGAPTYTITVSADQGAGSYKLAQGADNFTGTLYIGDGTYDYGTITVNGDIFKYAGAEYALTQTDGALLLDIVKERPAVFIYSSGTLTSSGSVISGAELLSGGNDSMYVSSGGVADSTVMNGGYLYVSSAGTADKTTVNIGARVCVSSGGMAVSTVVNGSGSWAQAGLLYLFSGGSAVNTTVNGGYVLISSGAAGSATTLNGGGVLQVFSGGVLNDTTVNSKGVVYISGGIANEIFLNSGGNLTVMSAGTANGTVLNSGIIRVSSGGIVNETTVNGKYLLVSSGGVANNTVVNCNGRVNLVGGGLLQGRLQIESGGFVSAYEGGIIDFTVSNRNTTDGYLINDLSRISGIPTFTITVSADQEYGVYKLAQGAENFTGTLSIGDGSVNYGTITVNGLNLVLNDKLFSLDQKNGDLTLEVMGVESASVFLYSSSILTAAENEITSALLFAGGNDTMHISSGGVAHSTIMESGTSMLISSGGVASNTTVNYSAAINISSGGTAAAVSGMGTMRVSSGGTASNVIVDQGGYIYVLKGGVASGVVVNSSGRMNLAQGGSAFDVEISSRGVVNFYLNSQNQFRGTVNGSAVEIKDGHLVNYTFASGVVSVCFGAVAENLSATGYARIIAERGGIIESTLFSGSHYNSNSSAIDIRSGGIARFTSLTNAGMTVAGEVSDTFLDYMGQLHIWSGGTATRTTVDSGASMSVDGTAVSTILNSSGFMTWGSSAVLIDTIINSGGSLSLNDDATFSGITVNNGG